MLMRKWYLTVQVVKKEAFDYIFRAMREVLEKGDAVHLGVDVEEEAVEEAKLPPTEVAEKPKPK